MRILTETPAESLSKSQSGNGNKGEGDRVPIWIDTSKLHRNCRMNFGREAVNLERLAEFVEYVISAPGWLHLAFLGALASGTLKAGTKLAPAHQDTIQSVLDGLFDIACGLASTDQDTVQSEAPLNQLRAIEKLAHPHRYGIEPGDIKEIAARHQSPLLARAWEIQNLISDFAHTVKPEKVGGPYTPTVRVVLETKPWPCDGEQFEIASRYWTLGTTLQAMVIKIYLDRLKKQGLNRGDEIDERSLKRDLQKARSLSETATSHLRKWLGAFVGDERITWFDYSGVDWKAAKRVKEAKRKKAKGKESRRRG